MTEFVGRTGSNRVYSYPETRRSGDALTAFARNFAAGPKTDTGIGGGRRIPWNLIDSTPSSPFTIVAGGVTVSIAGDVTGSFNSGDSVLVTPQTPAVLPPVFLTIASLPTFAAGFTTFDLSGPVDITTTGGIIEEAANSSSDVPITPRSTGVVLISGVVTIENASGDVIVSQIIVQLDSSSLPVPASLETSIPDASVAAIPFMAEVELPIGSASNIEVFVTGNGGSILAESSLINVQEVSVATG
jgi:hypothetical protein